MAQVYLDFTTNHFPWLTTIVVLPIFAGSLIFLFLIGDIWYTMCNVHEWS